MSSIQFFVAGLWLLLLTIDGAGMSSRVISTSGKAGRWVNDWDITSLYVEVLGIAADSQKDEMGPSGTLRVIEILRDCDPAHIVTGVYPFCIGHWEDEIVLPEAIEPGKYVVFTTTGRIDGAPEETIYLQGYMIRADKYRMTAISSSMRRHTALNTYSALTLFGLAVLSPIFVLASKPPWVGTVVGFGAFLAYEAFFAYGNIRIDLMLIIPALVLNLIVLGVKNARTRRWT